MHNILYIYAYVYVFYMLRWKNTAKCLNTHLRSRERENVKCNSVVVAGNSSICFVCFCFFFSLLFRNYICSTLFWMCLFCTKTHGNFADMRIFCARIFNWIASLFFFSLLFSTCYSWWYTHSNIFQSSFIVSLSLPCVVVCLSVCLYKSKQNIDN